jgi:predicted DNA repair protein MutK
MAGSSLLMLIDDIATLLDDVAVMSKLAVKKTAGVLGDDLALNAEQVTGVKPDRELPVVWAVAKGSFINKAILVPSALAISVVLPWAIIPLLMIGGAFLCFEGFEKVAHKLLHPKVEDELHHRELVKAVVDPKVDLVAFEKDKIKGAIRTDFILSAEILVITLGTVAASPFGTQVAVMVTMAILMTIGVYGLVGGIVKLDDAGLWLAQLKGENGWTRLKNAIGRGILRAAPYLMKTLSIVGTAAMFLVGGGILVHGAPPLHHLIKAGADAAATVPTFGSLLSGLGEIAAQGLVGVVAGGVLVGVFALVRKLRAKEAQG